ncbi:hypothetical protein V6N13_029221 [Hibiscus sabdariffa]|uniref:Uncharacterized protein n=2 Tax=Hibiscus sabdariffa TaxID=183260 RepID=A0ABR2A1B5_9ROSI
MESKRRGSMKNKVIFMSLYKAPKPASSVRYGNPVKPTSSAASAMASPTGFYGDAFVNRSTIEKHSDMGENYAYGGGELRHADEGIDARAASYISGVRERLSLERGD